MTKYLALGAIIATIVAIFSVHFFAKKNGALEKEIEQQQQQQQLYEENISVKNFQQKILNKTSLNTDIASRRKFLQTVFTERKNSDK